jgi:hypothetical protein
MKTTPHLHRYLAAARDPRVWQRTLILGLPVGLLQVALNQGDHWLSQHVDATVVAKSCLSPLLSCAIAFLSSAGAAHDHRPSLHDSSA